VLRRRAVGCFLAAFLLSFATFRSVRALAFRCSTRVPVGAILERTDVPASRDTGADAFASRSAMQWLWDDDGKSGTGTRSLEVVIYAASEPIAFWIDEDAL
jgi:hypothetical protein